MTGRSTACSSRALFLLLALGSSPALRAQHVSPVFVGGAVQPSPPPSSQPIRAVPGPAATNRLAPGVTGAIVGAVLGGGYIYALGRAYCTPSVCQNPAGPAVIGAAVGAVLGGAVELLTRRLRRMDAGTNSVERAVPHRVDRSTGTARAQSPEGR